MNKKTVAIIVGIVAVVAIIAVSIWGILSDAFSKTIYVTSVEFTNSNIQFTDDDSKIIVIEDDVTTVQLEWEVSPANATDKSVTFQSGNSSVTVSEAGLVTLNGVQSVQITMKSNDGTNKTDSVQIMEAAPAISSANVGIGSEGVIFTTPETEENDLILNQLTEDGGQIVLFQGVEYAFNTEAIITLQNNTNALYSQTDGKLITFGSEDFEMTITSGEYSRQIDVKVVPYISLFSKGTGIVDFEAMTSNLSANSDYLDTLADVYLVGTANAFHFNTTITSGLLASLNYSTCELWYTITKINNAVGEYTLSDYATVNSDGSITFLAGEDNVNIGKIFEVTVTPKYLQSGSTVNAITFRFQLNAGVNVFTHSQLKAAYADLSVSSINLHNRIVPVLSADQVNADGTAKNYQNAYDNDGKTGNVYARVVTAGYSGAVSDLTLNGNYFTIDGSNLPLVSASEDNGQSGSLNWMTTETPISSVQIAIFNIADARENIGDDATAVTYSNMTVIGNTTISPQYTTDDHDNVNISEEEAENVAALGSGYNGIMAKEGGNVTLNNCIVMKTLLSLFSAGTSCDFSARYTYLNENWAGSYYGYSTASLSLYNSTFGSSGGPSICFDDTSDTTGFSADGYTDRDDPTLTIGPNVIFDNYVSGTEGWFVVNGTSSIATGFKSTLNSSISALGQTITKTITANGQNYEVFNFILMEMPAGSLASNKAGGVQITINFDINDDGIADTEGSFTRAYNSTSTGAIGAYSTEIGFNKGLYIGATLMNEWLTNENLTAVLGQLAGAGNTLTTKQAIISGTCLAMKIINGDNSEEENQAAIQENQVALMVGLGSNPTVQAIIMQDSNVYGVIAECLAYYSAYESFPTEYNSIAAIIGEASMTNSSLSGDALVKAVAAYSSANGNVYNSIVSGGFTNTAYFDTVVSTVKADTITTLPQLTEFVTAIGLMEQGAKYFETKQNVPGFGSLYLIVEYFDIAG